jgi:uncharacterized membrane protein YuzA (DUF378 family)
MVLSRKKSLSDELTPLDRAAGVMTTLGALNWGLVAATNFDPVRAALGRQKARAAYGLMGASAAYTIVRGRQLADR